MNKSNPSLNEIIHLSYSGLTRVSMIYNLHFGHAINKTIGTKVKVTVLAG